MLFSKLNFSLLGSKTIWGAVIAILGYLSQPNVLAILPEKVAAVILGVGSILTAVGLRSAVANNGAAASAAEATKANLGDK